MGWVGDGWVLGRGGFWGGVCLGRGVFGMGCVWDGVGVRGLDFSTQARVSEESRMAKGGGSGEDQVLKGALPPQKSRMRVLPKDRALCHPGAKIGFDHA